MFGSIKLRTGGFTLLELLIALSLIALIMLLLFGGLRLGTRVWDGVEQRVRNTEDQRLARGFIRRSLLQAQQVVWPFERRSYALFFGDGEQVDFVSPLSGYVGRGGLYLMRLSLVSRQDDKDLVLQRWLLHPEVLEGEGEVPAWKPMEHDGFIKVPFDAPMGVYGSSLLLTGVREMELAYFGIPRGKREPEWLDEWNEEGTIPMMLRLRIESTEEWPELIIPLVEG